MSQLDWKHLAPWGDLQVKDDEGDVALCFGLAVDFYFLNGHTREKREAVLDCFRDYDRIAGSGLRWWVVENKSLSSVAKLKNRDMAPYLLSPKWETPEATEQAWSLIWHGGAGKEDASPLRIDGYGSAPEDAERDGDLSYLRASFPVMFWADKTEELLALVLRWSDLLQPVHGYGGVTLLKSLDEGLAQNHEDDESGFAMRYPGIEIDDPMATVGSTQQGIKGGNWLTLLGRDYLAKLGGAPALRDALGADFRFETFDRGALIVAGSVPEIGDRNQRIDTPRLRALAQVLRPIRTPEHWPCQADGSLSEAEAFNAWLARFD